MKLPTKPYRTFIEEFKFKFKDSVTFEIDEDSDSVEEDFSKKRFQQITLTG